MYQNLLEQDLCELNSRIILSQTKKTFYLQQYANQLVKIRVFAQIQESVPVLKATRDKLVKRKLVIIIQIWQYTACISYLLNF